MSLLSRLNLLLITLPRRRFLLQLAPFNLSTPLVSSLNSLSRLVIVTLTQSLVLQCIRIPVRLIMTLVFLQNRHNIGHPLRILIGNKETGHQSAFALLL